MLIEKTIGNVRDGVKVSEQVGESFAGIEESAGTVSQLVADIAAATNEQAQGMDQVNSAVAQMDKITQQNASNAQESASASEQLNTQAMQLNQMVAQLVGLVAGTKRVNSGQAKATLAHRESKMLTYTKK